MKVLLDIDRVYKETKVIIETPALDNSVQDVLDFIKGRETEFLVGKVDEMQHILKPRDIHFFHTENDSVLAVNANRSIN